MSINMEIAPSEPGAAHHAKTVMSYVGRAPSKHTYSNGRRKNVWHHVYQCPVCGCRKYPLSNPLRGRDVMFRCTGKAEYDRRQARETARFQVYAAAIRERDKLGGRR
jgi:hypothetical protein